MNNRPGPTIFLFTIIALVLQFPVLPLRAEQPSYKIFTTEEGLAHDSVNKIVRDSRGFLWFCTSEGLSRFDGKKFTNFTQDEGLPHRNVLTFLELSDGTYLVGTSLGLVVFNPKGRAYRWNVLESRLERNSPEPPMFQVISPGNTAQSQKRVFLSLAEDAAGTIWAGTAFGLFRIRRDGEDWRFEEFAVEKDRGIGFHELMRDSRGGLMIAASSGVYRIFNDRVEVVDKPGAGSLMESLDGRIWAGASGEPTGLRVFEFDGDKLKLSQTYKSSDGVLGDTFQNALKQLPDGRIFIGTFKGFQELRPGAKLEDTKLRFLKDYFVTSIAEDSAGKLWVGTDLKGAWQIAPSGFVTFGEETGISESEDIRSVHVMRDGAVLLPTRPGALYLRSDGKFGTIVPNGFKYRSWGWHFLDFQDRNGEWWVPAIDGLRRYPKLENYPDIAKTPPKKVYTKADGLIGNEIFVIFEDSRGDIWITNGPDPNGNTLSRWERSTEKIYSYTEGDGLPKSNGAIAFAEDRQGSVWFGHYFGGLVRYRNGRFELFTVKDGIPESQIDDLLVDSAGRLWIATTGRGIFRLDDTAAEKPVFTSISTQNGLSSNQVICLTEDPFQRVYAGTGRGINRIDRNDVIRVFTQADGLPGNYITRCAADKKGNLWFVSQNTLVRFSPDAEKNVVPPPVFVDKISVNGVPQKISALGETGITLPDLASDQTRIQIDFFALTFGVGENIRYQYRLDEQSWSSATDQRTLNLNLGPGQHFFEVRAIRSDGAASDKTATVSFKILPPVYLRWWFIAACAFGLGLIVFSFYRYRIANLRMINQALAEAKKAEEQLSRARAERIVELERVRSRIATDLHDDIGASLTQIAVLSEVAQAQSKGKSVSESLARITHVSNELVDSMSDIVWSINPSKDHLSDLTQRMRRFASDSLSAKGITFHFTPSVSYQELVVNSNLRREVFLIFKESINNIIKHSEARRVEIRLNIDDGDLILQIRDDGRGFEAEPAFTDSFSSIRMGGNGILSMQKRAREMGGELEIVSAVGRGTTVNLRLPMDIGRTLPPVSGER